MSVPNTSETSAARKLLAAVCVVLVLAGALVAFTLGVGGAMSSDSCRPGDEPFLCTSTGQNVAFWLPLAGWLASIVLAWLCVVRLDRRRKSPWLGVAVGVAVFSVIVVVDWLIVSG
ncbi:hypothetical protein [Amycolatopsis sp. NPDC049868]|uniref:hypothetical protein n=1 Tax=Amycolatopsis sp. NPDC049868 TaxID=3363934 RepID=UPI0037B90BB9